MPRDSRWAWYCAWVTTWRERGGEREELPSNKLCPSKHLRIGKGLPNIALPGTSIRYTWMEHASHSLVPRPPPFFLFFLFSFSIIHKNGRARKTGKAWEHLSREGRLVDARWTLGGRCPSTNSCAINDRASFLPVKLSTVNLVNILHGVRARWSKSSTCTLFERTPKNKSQGRPGNEATYNQSYIYNWVTVICVFTHILNQCNR